MSKELEKVEDDLRYFSKLEAQGYNCGFYVELLQEYRDRLLAEQERGTDESRAT